MKFLFLGMISLTVWGQVQPGRPVLYDSNGNVSVGQTLLGPNGIPIANSSLATVAIPSDFPATGITFYRDAADNYTSSFDPDAYIATWGITLTIYVNPATGNDTTGTGAVGAPYKSLVKALTTARDTTDTATKIVIVTAGSDLLIMREAGFLGSTITTFSGKRVYITPDNTAYIIRATGGNTAGFSLTVGKTYTYQMTRSSVVGVFDVTVLDANKVPTPYTRQTSIDTVEANAGSWWTDGTTLYVHAIGGGGVSWPQQVPLLNVTEELLVGLTNNSELFVRNLQILGSSSSTPQAYISGDYSNNKFVAYNSAFAFTNYWFYNGANPNTAAFDSLYVDGVKSTQIYNSTAAYASADGIGIHYSNAYTNQPTTTRQYYSLIFNSRSYSNGIGNTVAPNINNGFTTHGGANILIVGSEAYNTQGPPCAFVNGTYSVLIGSYCHDSVATALNNQHSALYTDSISAPNNLTQKLYLDDSRFIDSYQDIYSDGTGSFITRDVIASRMLLATYKTIAQLPSARQSAITWGATCAIASKPASPFLGQSCYFTDAASTSDCTSGGGSAKSLCAWNGSAWAKP